MSQENVELVRRGYEHFAQTGEPDTSFYSPEIEWHSAAEDPYAEPFRGVEGVRRLIQEVRESLDDFRTEPFEYLDGGDCVVAGLVHRGRGKGSAAEVEMGEWNVFLNSGGEGRFCPRVCAPGRRSSSRRAGGGVAISQEAVDLARALFEQFFRGDFSVYADLPDEFELVLAPEMPDAGTYRGPAARDWLTAWVNSFDRLIQEPVEFIDAGEDRVLAEFIQRGWTAGSDVPVELRTWSLSTVTGGNFVRTLLFQNRNDALEAAGLSK